MAKGDLRLDPLVRLQLMKEVREVITEILEQRQEKWVSGDELGKQFAFFSPSWLKHYGKLLPRERVAVAIGDDEEHRTGWCYPIHRIERMIAEGKLRRLVLVEGKGRAKRYEECFPTMKELDKILYTEK